MSLSYLPRSAWDARQSRGPTHLSSTGLHGTVIHWPGMGSRRLFAQADVARALRGWQNDHMDNPKKRWSDIAYQVAVDQAGRRWQLRGLTTQSAANGNDAANEAYGAILLVLGTGETPTGAMIASTRLVVADFRRLYPKALEIQTHNAVRTRYTGDGTDCPGPAATALVVSGQFNPEEDDMPYTPAELRAMMQAEIEEYMKRFWVAPTGTGTAMRAQLDRIEKAVKAQ